MKRLGLIIANILPILALIGEVALIINHQIGWAVGISIAIAVISFIVFCFHPYGEEVVFVVACTGYAVTITCAWLTNILLDSSASLCIGLLFGCATMMTQAIFTTKRIQGRRLARTVEPYQRFTFVPKTAPTKPLTS